jgi:hypothetical protein
VSGTCAKGIRAESQARILPFLLMAGRPVASKGKLHPFKCPVVAQDGTTVECKGGTHLADEQILGMAFYVKGIDDKIPGK